ncbi:MAG: outer membrane protein OmpA-like peptidoglycan-associated protein [Marinoscillum sp.]
MVFWRGGKSSDLWDQLFYDQILKVKAHQNSLIFNFPVLKMAPKNSILKYIIICFFVFACSSVSSAQSTITLNTIRLGDNEFEKFAYQNALRYYQYAFETDSTSTKAVARIGLCYVKLNQSLPAELWLKRLSILDTSFSDESKYLLAEQLIKNKKYEEAEGWYQQINSGSELASTRLTGIRSVNRMVADSLQYIVEEVDFNSEQSDFAPMFYEQGIAFVSSRKKSDWVQNTYKWDASDFLDFYYFNENDTINRLGKVKGLNSSYHEGPGQVYNNGKNVAFTRNSLDKKRLNRDNEGVANLNIYFSEKSDEGWVTPIPFEHNLLDYSSGHPTLNDEGTMLIFSSNMPGGSGGVDLVVSYWNANDSSWSKPVNLGGLINTKGDEMFPFLLDDQKLFFASNGHQGLGGLDIYYVPLLDGQPTGKVVNLGAPINSSQDDFSLIMSSDQKQGYFSSARLGGDDIFQFSANSNLITGVVMMDSLRLPLANMQVEARNSEDELLIKTTTDEFGHFQILLTQGVASSLVVTASGLRQLPSQSRDTIWMQPAFLKIQVVDALTLQPVENPHFSMNKLNDMSSLTFDRDRFIPIFPGTEYKVVTAAEGYYTHKDTFLTNDTYWGWRTDTIRMKKIVVGESIRLENIYYDVNSANLREESLSELDKLVIFMDDNATIKIELSSHTDSRGRAEYNQSLSQRRAESAYKYLIEHGVDKDRIKPVGYGEGKVINKCVDGIKCSDEEHQENRRTEIKIL